MKTKQEDQCVEEEWQAAQAALNDAQKLPGGPQRFEALKRAGQLRYEADKRRRSIEEEMDRNKKLVRADSEKRK
jgi:hypothetical protein